MTFTKFYTRDIEVDGVMGAVFDLDDFETVVAENPNIIAFGGMMLLEENYESEVIRPQFGRPWLRINRKCSWLHLQNGYICAGAGGLNSMPVRKLT